MENPEDSTQCLVELKSEFRVVTGYKFHIQKLFPETVSKSLEMKFLKNISTKYQLKYRGINLTKNVEDL